VADVLAVSALELRDPMLLCILVEADDATFYTHHGLPNYH